MRLKLLFVTRAVGAGEGARWERLSGHAGKSRTDQFQVDRPVKLERGSFFIRGRKNSKLNSEMCVEPSCSCLSSGSSKTFADF